MGIWEILGIEQTRDIAVIKRAYAQQARHHHPEEDPEGFGMLRTAYKLAMALAQDELAAYPPAEGPAEAEPQGEESAPPAPAPARGGYAFEALDGGLERGQRQQAARMDAFFGAAEDIYDDIVARYSVEDWQGLFAGQNATSLLGSAKFVERFVSVFTGYDLPDEVWKQALLPFVRQWRVRWLGTPQWTAFNRIEDPVARQRQDEHARADDFIRRLDAVYQSKKTRGDSAAWQAVFALPQFGALQEDSYFNRVFARFVINRREIPQNIWDEVLTPLMGTWRATQDGHPLWVSFAWAMEEDRGRKGPFRRLRGFMDDHPRLQSALISTLVVLLTIAAALVFLWYRESPGTGDTSIPAYDPAAAQGAIGENAAVAELYRRWWNLTAL